MKWSSLFVFSKGYFYVAGLCTPTKDSMAYYSLCVSMFCYIIMHLPIYLLWYVCKCIVYQQIMTTMLSQWLLTILVPSVVCVSGLFTELHKHVKYKSTLFLWEVCCEILTFYCYIHVYHVFSPSVIPRIFCSAYAC